MNNPALKALEALGHIEVKSGHCTAIEKGPDNPTPGRPKSIPSRCGLKAGHDGPHIHIYGTKRYPMRDELITHNEPIQICDKCGYKWPCQDAEKVLAAFDEL